VPIGGDNPYPTVQEVTNLVRSQVQDDMQGATATLGEGQIFPDSKTLSVTMGNFFNSALRTLARKLRNTTGPMLIRDNVQILGIPPLTSPTAGLAVPDPSVQVALQYVGYFDGVTFNNQFALPADCLQVERVWERINGSGDEYVSLDQPAQGIPSLVQGIYNRCWEWRQDGVWMPGSTETMDIRLRYKAQVPVIWTGDIDTSNTFIPINDCQDALAGLIVNLIAIRQGAMLLPAALQWANDQVNDFLNEQTKREQGIPYPVKPFGEESIY
jgi:hypothetical protein